jgi:hypothetical protein
MITLVKVQMSSLVSTMSTRWWKELNVVEGSACNYYCPTWKPTFRTMATKVLQITWWVPMRLLPWTQHKRWIPIGSMGCVSTQQRMLAIKRWGSPSHVQSVVQKIGEDNRKVGKISWIVNQAPTLGPKHDKIWAWWASDVSSKNMLKMAWWCRCSEMESWNQTICYPMSYSSGGRHTRVGGGRRSHAALKCCWKGNMLLLTHAKVLRKKGRWSTINLVAMTKATRVQLPK